MTRQEQIQQAIQLFDSGEPLTPEQRQNDLREILDGAILFIKACSKSGTSKPGFLPKSDLTIYGMMQVSRWASHLLLEHEQIEAAKAQNVESKAKAERISETQAKVTKIILEGPEWSTQPSTDSTPQA